MVERKSHQILTEGINPDKSLSSSQSGISISLSREDILAVYEEGPEAVVALVQTLCSITNKQAARIAELEERVKSLEDQINKNSRNSSKPPSTDPFRKIKGQRKPSGKSVGGQKGHKGHTLEMADNPDHLIVHPVIKCESCGRSLCDENAASMNGVRYSTCRLSKWKYSNIRLRERFAPIAAASTKLPFLEKSHIRSNMELV
jgi:hypothetical protein